ncbi:DUF4174 domain-containing protein [Sulfitobacter sabulilitoris]|uniref:DUF4174 domain-containing protein n=1 Tax=Sulfitobacter sabulilitoris TaxID=2562655 RepID=A0A5S3PGY6_9RHOB|nr:DUF4174 domain-containing protein [Sulfitobacter sabulilitoris]TMM50912.1 DUF4174 domain-containing protein [Sulfitobacter sabulilitoris]
MTRLLALVLACVFAVPAVAQTSGEDPDQVLVIGIDGADLNEFIWKKRPIVVFADSPNDPLFEEQMELLLARPDALRDRDVVILTDTDPSARSDLRMKLRPRGFMLVLIGKDGGIKLRKPFPWDVREISRSIDKMPIRQREIRNQKNSR